MDARLIVIEGKASRSEIALKLPTIIGRRRDSGLVIMHKSVSRQHCELFEQDGRVCVRDNHSANGTFVNEHRVSQRVLHPGDKLRVGPLLFRVEYVYRRPSHVPAVAPSELDEEPTPPGGLGHPPSALTHSHAPAGMSFADDDGGDSLFDALDEPDETALSEDDGFGFLGDEDDSPMAPSTQPLDEESLFDPLNAPMDEGEDIEEADLNAFAQFDHHPMSGRPASDDPSEGPSQFGLFDDPDDAPADDDSQITSQRPRTELENLSAEISQDDENLADEDDDLGFGRGGFGSFSQGSGSTNNPSAPSAPPSEPTSEAANSGFVAESPTDTDSSEPAEVGDDDQSPSANQWGMDDLASLGVVVEQMDDGPDADAPQELADEAGHEATPRPEPEDDDDNPFASFTPMADDDQDMIDPNEFSFGEADSEDEDDDHRSSGARVDGEDSRND